MAFPIAQFEIGNMRNFVYLVLDWKTKQAAIVDPQKDLSEPLALLKDHGFDLTHLLLTHTHHDHVAGVPELLKNFPKIELVVHKEDVHRLGAHALSHPHIHYTKEGEILRIGELTLKVLHTPGHSAGECCFFLERNDAHPPSLLTGDTVFIRDCGRTDLPTGDVKQMFESLQRIRRLPPETVIFPGHHYQPETTSTLERELRESPPFQCKSAQELEALP